MSLAALRMRACCSAVQYALSLLSLWLVWELTSACAGERNLDKRFRKWLAECHAHLDKHVRFEGLGDSQLQVCFRPGSRPAAQS